LPADPSDHKNPIRGDDTYGKKGEDDGTHPTRCLHGYYFAPDLSRN